jgi:hypothetical protein
VLYYFNSEFTNKINKITNKINKNAFFLSFYRFSCDFIDFVCDFIDFICELTVKIIEHTVASYKTSDFNCVVNYKFLKDIFPIGFNYFYLLNKEKSAAPPHHQSAENLFLKKLRLFDNMSTVSYGGPIDKYAQTTPSAHGVSLVFNFISFQQFRKEKEIKIFFSNADLFCKSFFQITNKKRRYSDIFDIHCI